MIVVWLLQWKVFTWYMTKSSGPICFMLFTIGRSLVLCLGNCSTYSTMCVHFEPFGRHRPPMYKGPNPVIQHFPHHFNCLLFWMHCCKDLCPVFEPFTNFLVSRPNLRSTLPCRVHCVLNIRLLCPNSRH